MALALALGMGCVVVDAGTEVTICYRKSILVNMIVFILGMGRWGLVSDVSGDWKWRKQ